MVKDNQDWEYCSVHMSVQKLANEDLQDKIKSEDYKKTANFGDFSSKDVSKDNSNNDVSNKDINDENIGNEDANSEECEQIRSLHNTLSSNNTEQTDNSLLMTASAVEFTSIDIDLDIADEIELDSGSSSDTIQNYALNPIEQKIALADKDGKNLDIDIFFPSLLLSFESLLNRVFDDLINGIKNHDLYSMGLAQYLKLEDEQVNGNEVKLRYRLPIDNIKLVFEAMSH